MGGLWNPAILLGGLKKRRRGMTLWFRCSCCIDVQVKEDVIEIICCSSGGRRDVGGPPKARYCVIEAKVRR